MDLADVPRRRKMVRKYGLLGIPPDVAVAALVAIGHSVPEDGRGSRRRRWKPLGEVVRWKHW